MSYSVLLELKIVVVSSINFRLSDTGTSRSDVINNERCIILIRPRVSNAKELLNDPIEIVSAIKQSKFGVLNIIDIKTNKRKGLLVAEFSKPGYIIEELLNVKHLGKWEVECCIPNRDKYSVGVISLVGFKSDNENSWSPFSYIAIIYMQLKD